MDALHDVRHAFFDESWKKVWVTSDDVSKANQHSFELKVKLSVLDVLKPDWEDICGVVLAFQEGKCLSCIIVETHRQSLDQHEFGLSGQLELLDCHFDQVFELMIDLAFEILQTTDDQVKPSVG